MGCALKSTMWECPGCGDNPQIEGKCLEWCSAELARCRSGNNRLHIQIHHHETALTALRQQNEEIVDAIEKIHKSGCGDCDNYNDGFCNGELRCAFQTVRQVYLKQTQAEAIIKKNKEG